MKELKANPNRKGRGLILEAQLDKGRGPVATVLVQKGTLNVGDNVTVGTAFGKIRAMIDDKGRRVKNFLILSAFSDEMVLIWLSTSTPCPFNA